MVLFQTTLSWVSCSLTLKLDLPIPLPVLPSRYKRKRVSKPLQRKDEKEQGKGGKWSVQDRGTARRGPRSEQIKT